MKRVIRGHVYQAILISFCVLLIGPSTIHADETCSDCLQKGLRLYEAMELEASLAELQSALERQAECTKQELVTVYLNLAKVQIVLEQKDAATESIKSALRIDPYLTFDPSTTSNKILAVANRARQEIRDENQPQPMPETTPEPEPTETSMSPRRIGAWATLGIAGAAAIGSGATFGVAYSEYGKTQEAADDKDWDARDAYWTNTQTYATTSYVLAGVAGGAAVTSLVLFLTSRDGARTSSIESPIGVSAAPVLTPELSGIVVQIRF